MSLSVFFLFLLLCLQHSRLSCSYNDDGNYDSDSDDS